MIRSTSGVRHRRRHALALGFATFAAPALAQTPCADLAAEKLAGRGTVTSAELVTGGSFAAPATQNAAGFTITGLPDFCRVAATLRPSDDSNIRIEVWLPQGAAWNGRYNGTGNGGFNGAIGYAPLATGLKLGFATANTDQGTSPSTTIDGRALVGRPQKWIDFGYRATHVMTLAAKQLIAAHYGSPPSYSYFTGCSNGGEQGLQEAQRYPEDYDGILAGAPANNRTNLSSSTGWIYTRLRQSPASWILRPQAELITRAALAACVGQDGGLPSDPYLTDPRQCRWQPSRLACPAGATDTSQCLTPPQVQAAEQLYDGPRNPRTNERLYTGVKRTSESGHNLDWVILSGLFNPAAPSAEPLFNGTLQWVFGPNYKSTDYDFDRDVRQLNNLLARIQNANDPDLTAFRTRGGKLIAYHGWLDVLVPAQDQVNYYLRAVTAQANPGRNPRDIRGGIDSVPAAALAQTQESYRLFMVPGMGHCSSGPGPNVFTPSLANLFAGDPERNAFLALQRWVEEGAAPAKLIATKFVNDNPAGAVLATRPLCPFPQIAQYKGSGDPNDAANFVCAAGPVGPNQNVSAELLR